MKATRPMKSWMPLLVVGTVLLGVTAGAWADGPGRGPSDRNTNRGRWNSDRRPAPPQVQRRDHNDHGRYDRGRHDRDDSRFGVRIKLGDRPVLRTVQTWVAGYYTKVTTQVLIEPARTESRYIEPVTETRYPSNGPPYTVVLQPGGYQTVDIPARYETRTEQVWVPGHYETRQVVTRDCSPRISIGGVIVF